MLKVKLYLVTYKNNDMLLENIRSLKESQCLEYLEEVTIINNYSSLPQNVLDECDFANIIDNELRPDFSTGHLSRNWNQAIINGFKDLNNPDVDIVVCGQNDIEWKRGWLGFLLDKHKGFDFITMGHGDAFHSYLPRHIKKVGLWDERFCNIACHEHDYFLRSTVYNGNKSSINSLQMINPIKNKILNMKPSGAERNDPSHVASKAHHNVSQAVFKHKWGLSQKKIRWTNTKGPKSESFIMYPYFEKEVETLKEQKYVL